MLAASLSLGGQEAWSTVGTADGLLKAGLIALVCQACLYYEDLYDLRIVADRRELFARTFHSLAAASLILAAVYFLHARARRRSGRRDCRGAARDGDDTRSGEWHSNRWCAAPRHASGC